MRSYGMRNRRVCMKYWPTNPVSRMMHVEFWKVHDVQHSTFLDVNNLESCFILAYSRAWDKSFSIRWPLPILKLSQGYTPRKRFMNEPRGIHSKSTLYVSINRPKIPTPEYHSSFSLRSFSISAFNETKSLNCSGVKLRPLFPGSN